MKYTVIIRGPDSSIRTVLEGEISCLIEWDGIEDGFSCHLEDEGVDYEEFRRELDEAEINLLVEDA